MSKTADRATSKNLSSLRALWPFLLPYRGLMLAALIALVLTASISLVFPLAVRRVIDTFNVEQVGLLDQYFGAAIAISALLALGTAVRYSLVTRLGERVVTDIRKAVFGRVIGMGPSFYETILTGEVLEPNYNGHHADPVCDWIIGFYCTAQSADLCRWIGDDVADLGKADRFGFVDRARRHYSNPYLGASPA